MESKRILIGLCCATLAASGCGRSVQEKIQEKIAEKAIEAQGGGHAKVDMSGDSMTIKTDEGTVKVASGKDVKLPASFPSDVHVMKDLRIESVVEVPNGCAVSFRGKADVQKVLDTYKESMTQQGWTQEVSMNMGDQSMASYRKEKRMANVAVGMEDKEVRVVLTLAQEDKDE